ncbi:MAG: GtrA family protein [Protaetiibacter sp.]
MRDLVRPLPPVVTELVRYYLAAGVMALFYLGLYGGGLLLGIPYFLAIVIAQALTISVAFPVYRRFVFRSKGALWPDFLRFLSVWMGGAIAGFIATPLLVELVRIDPFIAHLIAVVVVSILSFLGHRFFSFRRRAGTADSPDTRASAEDAA